MDIVNTLQKKYIKLYNVGVAKTGSTSLSKLFKVYKSEHEFLFEETINHIYAYKKGEINTTQFKEFILQRDEQFNSDYGLDSSTFNHFYADVLMEDFPKAKFILPIRDCYTWLESVLNMGLRFKYVLPDFIRKYMELICDFKEPFMGLGLNDSFLKDNPKYLDNILSYWRDSITRILTLIPEDRLLVIKVDELSNSIEKIADFSGVSAKILSRDGTLGEEIHRNKVKDAFFIGKMDVPYVKGNWFAEVDKNLLKEKFELYCKDLMSEYFPDKRQKFLKKLEV